MRKVLLAVVLVFVCMTVTGCGIRNEKEAGNWRITSENNALQYVQKKYGITSQIVDSLSLVSNDMFSSFYISDTLVTLKDESGREFQVITDGRNSNSDGRDNYQMNEIKADYELAARSLMSTSPESFEFCYYPSNKNDKASEMFMISEKYEGYRYSEMKDKIKALNTMFQSCSGTEDIHVLVKYTKEKVPSDFNVGDEIDSFAGELPEADYVAGLVYNSVQNLEKYPVFSVVSDMGGYGFQYALYLDSMAYRKKDQHNSGDMTTYYKFESGHMDDFYYIMPNHSPDSYKIVKESMTDAEAAFYKGRGFISPQNTGSKYYFEGNISDEILLIFKEKDKNLQLACRYLSTKPDKTTDYLTLPVFKNYLVKSDEYDYYKVSSVNKPDFSFCFLYEADN